VGEEWVLIVGQWYNKGEEQQQGIPGRSKLKPIPGLQVKKRGKTTTKPSLMNG